MDYADVYGYTPEKKPDFAFVEVQDDKTFALNAKVVREIVELLQVFKFRYEQKHEFLGNFFELLLNTSMKQEAGQYFTPVPITRFIISALPLREFVQHRVDARSSEPLPAVIDYACGSGHFLTEYMSQLQDIIDSGIDTGKATPIIQKQFQAWKGLTKFTWAKDVIYGIDLDNRLVKTTKVSAFFNGDGEAEVIWANGLDHFSKSTAYRGKLKRFNNKDNGQFDILISNPPYSVEAFKSTIRYGKESFELYPYLTDNSSEIECLFVERMKQLLKTGGWAAVILPSSILTNSGIHARAREILLRCFYIKGIVELGPNTFMKTNTNTVILFLERRSEDDSNSIRREVNRFFHTKADAAAAGLENAFSTYVSNVYEGLPFKDYISLFGPTPTDAMKHHELYRDYVASFGENFLPQAIAMEKDKMLYFLLTYRQNVVLVKTGAKSQEKKFLGYEFSERRGHEGLHWLPGGTKLYDENNPLNPHKVSSYIYHAFLGRYTAIDDSLSSNIFYSPLNGLIEYGTNRFDKVINLGKGRAFTNGISSPYTKFPPQRIGDVSVMIRRGKSAKYGESHIQIIKSGQARGYLEFDFTNRYFVSDTFIPDERNLVKGDLLINSTGIGTAGRVTLFDLDGDYVADGHITIVRLDHTRILPKYALYALADIGFKNIEAMAKGQSGQIELPLDTIREIRISLPPIDIQQKIVAEIEKAEQEEEDLILQIGEENSKILSIIDNCYHTYPNHGKLRDVASYSSKRVNAQELDQDTYVGVDNLLPGLNGKRPSNYVPASGTAIAYEENDILLSNIRPYLKKAWLANQHGGASGDVLVLQIDASAAIPKYIFSCLATDRFFNYEMENIGSSAKMPRADKRKVLDFPIPVPPLDKQQLIIDEITRCETEITRLVNRRNALNAEKDGILKKYL